MPIRPIAHLTIEQYLEIERLSEVRHEYLDGQLFALQNGGREPVSITLIDTRSMATHPVTHVTLERYLEIERRAEFPSEYINGEIFSMSGGTPNHARIALNTAIRLTEQLRGRSCETFGSNLLRLYSAKHNVVTYPDVLVTCGPNRFLDTRRDTITDATVVVEVLSPATQNYDRGEKFRIYHSLPSFSEYLLLAQDTMRAEHHVRQPDGAWLFREFTDPAAEVDLQSINCRLQLGSLYERVEFEAETLL